MRIGRCPMRPASLPARGATRATIDRTRRDPEAGLEHRPPPHLGEEEDRAEEQRRERRAEHQHRDVRPPEVGDAEQVEVERRGLRASLVGDEHGEDDESGAEEPERAGAEPPVVLGSDDAVGQQSRRAGDEDDAEERRDLGLGGGRLVQVATPGDDRVDADRAG